jgi:hypothetical protein
MSDREIVNAYLDGRVSRRTLIRRLVAAGVSLGAAVSYAQVLKPERAFARADSDHYPTADVKIIEEDLDKVANNKRVRVRFHADEDCTFKPVEFRVYHVVHGSYTLIGTKARDFKGPDTEKMNLPINPAAATTLGGLDKAKIVVTWVGHDKEGKDQSPGGSDTATLKA